MNPLDIELPDDALGVRAGEMQNMDLEHLRDVLEEVQGLAHGEEAEQRDPGGRDEPLGVARRARHSLVDDSGEATHKLDDVIREPPHLAHRVGYRRDLDTTSA